MMTVSQKFTQLSHKVPCMLKSWCCIQACQFINPKQQTICCSNRMVQIWMLLDEVQDSKHTERACKTTKKATIVSEHAMNKGGYVLR
jgi:hypothetical protein